MTLRHLMLVIALGSASALLATSASARETDEQRIKLEDVPAAARAGLEREAKGSPILEVEVEKKHGKKLYEAHVKQGGEVVGIVVDEQGALIGKHSEKHEKEHEAH